MLVSWGCGSGGRGWDPGVWWTEQLGRVAERVTGRVVVRVALVRGVAGREKMRCFREVSSEGRRQGDRRGEVEGCREGDWQCSGRW